MGISGISTSSSSWRYTPSKREPSSNLHSKGTQIDLLIDRSDRIINLCEMKFSVNQFRITDEYESTLLNRIEVFREQTKTTKTLVYTFVTARGVADGIHKSILNSEVTMNDLFC